MVEVARSIGLDAERLKRDMGAEAITAAIERNQELARQLRITGTPAFVIGEEILRGAADIEVMRGLIFRARKKESK